MSQHRTSYWKTFLLAASVSVVAAASAIAMWSQVPGFLSLVFSLAASIVAALGGAIALGTLAALYRDAADATNKGDMFLELNKSRSEDALAALRPGRRSARTGLSQLFRPRQLSVGDVVEVRSLDEILSTLDESGRLDGLPFMP
jgi:hypothetical protein